MRLANKNARYILAREREQKAIELRKDGLSYRRIGDLMGVSDKAVMKMVRKVVERINNITNESAESVRTLELERLDRMWEGLWPEAQMGDIAAVKTCIQLQERRAAYLGLDAPKKATVDIDVRTDIDESITRLVEKFKSSGQVSVPVGINGPTQPAYPARGVVELVMPCG